MGAPLRLCCTNSSLAPPLHAPPPPFGTPTPRTPPPRGVGAQDPPVTAPPTGQHGHMPCTREHHWGGGHVPASHHSGDDLGRPGRVNRGGKIRPIKGAGQECPILGRILAQYCPIAELLAPKLHSFRRSWRWSAPLPAARAASVIFGGKTRFLVRKKRKKRASTPWPIFFLGPSCPAQKTALEG